MSLGMKYRSKREEAEEEEEEEESVGMRAGVGWGGAGKVQGWVVAPHQQKLHRVELGS